MKKSAFTLVECLVVIFVLMLFAVVPFMYFARAREDARRSSCQSNLKQIALGFKQYTRDYDERFPMKDVPPNPGVTVANYKITHWMLALQPYLKSVSIFQCPSEPSSRGTDYYYNPYVSGRLEEQFENQAAFVMLAEGVDIGDSSKAIALTAQRTGDNPPPFARHLDGSNYAFVDGHVKWLHSTSPPRDMDLNGALTFRGKIRQKGWWNKR